MTVGAGSKTNADRTGEEKCLADTFSTGATDVCETCGAGFSNEGSSTCGSCTPGRYKQVSGSIKPCEDCTAGKYSETGTNSEAGCLDCGVGTYSSSGASYCVTVGAGSKNNADRTGEEMCTADTFSTGATNVCTSCGGGHSETGSSSCVSTPPGHYYDGAADVPCPGGTFSANGASSLSGCEDCSGAGEYSAAGAAYCSTNPAGTFVTLDRSSTAPCPPSTYSTGAADTCSLCSDPGEFSHSPSTTSCSRAPPGHEPNDSRTGTVSCLVDHYSPAGHDCLPCLDGKHAQAGVISCDACPPGEYFNSITRYCQECPASTFAENGADSLSQCLACDKPGEYSLSGSSTCKTAGAGFKPNKHRSWTEPCPVNTFSVGATDECSHCVGGHSREEASSCVSTPPGYFWNNTHDFPCPAGTFSAD